MFPSPPIFFGWAVIPLQNTHPSPAGEEPGVEGWVAAVYKLYLLKKGDCFQLQTIFTAGFEESIELNRIYFRIPLNLLKNKSLEQQISEKKKHKYLKKESVLR
jgi:hypothetical protein